MGFAVSLTVTFTVCDAQQIALSPSGAPLSPTENLATLRTVRPEQKTPPVLAPLRVSDQSLASRKQIVGTPRYFDSSKCYRYSLIPARCWLKSLSSQLNSGQTTRGPPLMDPPHFC